MHTQNHLELHQPSRRARRDHAQRQSRRRYRAVLGPVAGTLAAGLLVSLATLANPVVAHAESPSGTRVESTGAAVTTGGALTDTAAEALFDRTTERAQERASSALAAGSATLAAGRGKVDTAALETAVTALVNHAYLDTTSVQSLTTAVVTQTSVAAGQVAAVDKAAADAAAQAAAEAAAAAQAIADRIARGTTPDGAREVGAELAAEQYGWGADQAQCLDSLWTKESGWNYQAENASSGAYGIPQSLPGSKMSTIADDWATNPVTQITWGLSYIARGYGTPCSAWSHSQSVNWY